MSIQIPIRLKILQNGAAIGYVETLNFVSGATISKNGPIANISVSGGGGGGGDADSLQGHPASYFATQTDMDAAEADILTLSVDVNDLLTAIGRAQWWDTGGVVVSDVDPGPGITYAQWLAGATGDFAWLRIP